MSHSNEMSHKNVRRLLRDHSALLCCSHSPPILYFRGRSAPTPTENNDDEQHTGDGRLSVEHNRKVVADLCPIWRVVYYRRRNQEAHRVADLKTGASL